MARPSREIPRPGNLLGEFPGAPLETSREGPYPPGDLPGRVSDGRLPGGLRRVVWGIPVKSAALAGKIA